MAVGRAEEKADRLQSRAKALDALVDIGALEPAGGGDYVENELKRLTSGAEIDDELERLKAEIAAPRLPVQAGDGEHGSRRRRPAGAVVAVGAVDVARGLEPVAGRSS